MTKSKRWLSFALSLVLLLSCFSAVTTITANAATKAPKKIYIRTNASIVEPIRTVDIGGTLQATVSKTVPSSASKAVTWKSSKTSIATVSSKGVITGKKTGTTYITATSTKNKKVTATLKVYVRDVNPYALLLNYKSKTITVGDKATLKATVKHVKNGLNPKDKVATWRSSNKAVATVSKGVVTAVAPGTATITAKAGNKSKQCVVTVKAKNVEATGISFAKESIDLLEKEYGENPLIVEPEGANAEIEYTSDKESVAIVNSTGGVTALAEGSATITAKVKGNDKLTASYKVNVIKDTSIWADPDNANQYRIKPDLLNYKAKEGEPYIATVGQWRKDANKSGKDTYFVNGEALSDHDIIISNGKMGMVLAVGTRNPWGYPAGSVMDAGYIKNGTPARDTIWSLEVLMNGWDSWAPENCGTVEFDLVNYDFTECKEDAAGFPAVKVTRKYTQIVTADDEYCDMDVTTYYSVPKDGDYAYMYDVVTNNGKTDVNGKTTRFALTNKGDDGGSLKYLKNNRAVISYGNKTGQEYAIAYTVPEKQKDSKVNVDGNGGSLGYKELRTPCSYPAGSTTTYQEYFMVSDKADTEQITKFTNKINEKTTMTVSGTVVENDSDTAVADAVVVVKDSDDNLVGFYRADNAGKFSIELPKGGYDLYVEKDKYGKGEKKSVIKATSDLKLKAGAQKEELTINLKDQNGNPVWGKVDIDNEYPEVRYTGNSVFQAKEKGVIKAQVADLDKFEATVYGQGYFFYSDTVKITEADVKDGVVDVTIEQKIARPEGWLSGDLHHHANKNDGFADPEDAIPSHLASALDVSYITDHDFTVNNKKAFDLVNTTYKGQMAGFVPSEEISCSWAHFNVLPQDKASYDFFLDANKENHVMNQFGKFTEFTKETHDKGADITANHPWYSYGLFSTAAKNSVPGGYTDDYDAIEINACSADSENGDTLISATKLWTAYLEGGNFFDVKVEKPHYLVAGSDTHDVLVPGVTNKGEFARGESQHYNSGKARTFAKAKAEGSITDVGLAFNEAVSEGNSYISFGPVLNMDKVPGGEAQTAANGSFDFTINVKSLAKVKDVILLTKDAAEAYTTSGLIGTQQDQTTLKYVKEQSKIGEDANAAVKDGNYTFKVPVKAGEKTWAAVLVMDENGNYAITNPYWITGGAQ